MRKMNKILVCVAALICVMTMFAGCKSTLAYTFNVDNGDKIKISMDTTDQYKMSSEVPFTISKDGQDLTQGTFIQGEAYEQYAKVAQTDEKAVLLDSGTKDGNEYVFWSYDGKEFNYAIMVSGSNTGVILGNAVSEESAKECFNRMTITKEG